MKNLSVAQCSAITGTLTRIQGIRRNNGEIPGLREIEEELREAFPELAAIQSQSAKEVADFLKMLGL